MLGDAGEHYAVSQFTFRGMPATKMPDGWTAYDLAVETGQGLTRVSVKTRSETQGWRTSKWFSWDDRVDFDWMVFVFKSNDNNVRAWVIPHHVLMANANTPGPNRKKTLHERDIQWNRLQNAPLNAYEDNWTLEHDPKSKGIA